MHCLENLQGKRGIDQRYEKLNIKAFLKLRKVRYKSSITVLDKIRNLSKILIDYAISRSLHVALNEGITEWVKQKTGSGHDTYDMEVNIVKQIENIVGAKKIIETVNKRPDEMKDLLNMTKEEFIHFSSQMDYLLFLSNLKNKIHKGLIDNEQFDKLVKFNQEEGKYLNDEIESTTMEIQTQLVKKLIIPYFEKNQHNNYENFERALNCMELISEYCKFSKIDTKIFRYTNEAKELKNILDKIIIQYIKQNFRRVDDLDRNKVFEMFNKIIYYDFIDSDIDSDEDYARFKDKLANRMNEIILKEDAVILDNVRQKASERDKIDVNLFLNDYSNKYSSYNINYKVIELLLKRKLTYGQIRDLLKEVMVYIDCGKVISKKDIKKQKNQDGHMEYYIIVDGVKYTNEHLKKMKFGRKFLNANQYEVINREKEEEERQTKVHTPLSSIWKKRQGFSKENFSKKKSKTTADNIDSPVEEFRDGLKVEHQGPTNQGGKRYKL